MITINGTAIKTPQRFTVDIPDIGKTGERSASGLSLSDRVAVKRELFCEWGGLTNTEISTILTAVSAFTFVVVYPDPQTGAAKTITCRAENKSAPMYKNTSGTPFWEGLSMTLIEQ